jgi:predicted porin
MSTKLKRCALFTLLTGFAATACAQFDYSYNGVADFSYGQFEPSGALPERRFNSNSMSASFVGGSVKYGLDGGWAVGATLETFIRFQEMKVGRRDSDPLLSRNAFASLTSPYGTVRVGRLQTYLFETTNRFNAFGNSPSFSPALRHVFLSGNLESVQGDFYWNRAISYSSPTLEGATVNLMFARGPDHKLGQFSAANIVYSRGLLALAASVQQVKVDNGLNDPAASDPIDERTWQLAATYNFGVARAFGVITQTQDHALEVRSTSASAGVSVPLGPGSVLAQFGHTQAQGPAVDRQHTSTSLAYLYPYNSLIDLYATAMDDRVRQQTKGISAALGVRARF